MNFTSRLAGVGKQAGMSQADVMAFASVLDQNMVGCERDFASVDDAMAQVRKYTGMAAEEVAELNDVFRQMDTRSRRLLRLFNPKSRDHQPNYDFFAGAFYAYSIFSLAQSVASLLVSSFRRNSLLLPLLRQKEQARAIICSPQ